jgi:hypothetical protein
MKNMLDVPVIDYNQFTYNKGTFATFASDLKPKNFLGRVYRDAADAGFKLKGKVHEVLFLLVEEQRNTDRDVTAWVFEPSMTDSMKLNLGNVKVKVFNT